MTKIEQNEILEKVETLDPKDAKNLLKVLVDAIVDDMNWQKHRAETCKNPDWAVAKEEASYVLELKLMRIRSWIDNDF